MPHWITQVPIVIVVEADGEGETKDRGRQLVLNHMMDDSDLDHFWVRAPVTKPKLMTSDAERMKSALKTLNGIASF